jgi:hypothetical protein
MTIAARGENARGVVLVFWTALAILALHAATDSFIAPEPGTGPPDHLLRGSVSLAILVVAAVVYPRLQAGGRAAQRDDRIGGMGFSVGGEMMLQAAASNTGLRAVVSEGAGVRSVREDLLRGPRGWLALPESAVQSAALTIMSADLRRARRGRRGAEPRLFRGGLGTEDGLEDRRGRTCRRLRRAGAGV